MCRATDASGESWNFTRPILAVFAFLHKEQPTQNWSGQGESDCLIKTKHCDGLDWC